MKRTPLIRRAPLVRGAPLRRVSLNRAAGIEAGTIKVAVGVALPKKSARQRAREARFKPIHNAFMTAHKSCQWPGCRERSSELHHSRGKVGEMMFIVRWFRAACWFHHRYAHHHVEEARAAGFWYPRDLAWVPGEDVP